MQQNQRRNYINKAARKLFSTDSEDDIEETSTSNSLVHTKDKVSILASQEIQTSPYQRLTAVRHAQISSLVYDLTFSPSRVQTPPPSRVRTPPRSRVRTPPPSRVRTPLPSRVRTPPPSHVRTPPPSCLRIPPPSRVRTYVPAHERTPPQNNATVSLFTFIWVDQSKSVE